MLSWRGIVDTITVPGVGRLIVIGFFAVFAFAAFEGTFALFLRERFGWMSAPRRSPSPGSGSRARQCRGA